MITLYNDQQPIVDNIKKEYARGKKSVLLLAPTGFGKTVVFSYLIMKAISKGTRCLVLSERLLIIGNKTKGTAGTFEDFNIPYQIINSNTKKNIEEIPVKLAMAQTMKKRLSGDKKAYWEKVFFETDFIFCDECHSQHFNFFFENRFIDRNKHHVLGLSATPERKGKQRQLGFDYDVIVDAPSIMELITMNRLLSCVYISAKNRVETDNIKEKAGDFDTNALFNVFDKSILYDDVVNVWKEHTNNTVTLCFCVDILHCIKTCEVFNMHGIKAKFITSSPQKASKNATPAEEDRKTAIIERYKEAYNLYSGKENDIVEQWQNGEFHVLINAGKMTTGVNFPFIKTIIINLASKSWIKIAQIIGRASRKYLDMKSFNLIDMSDNIGNNSRFGMWESPRRYNLWHHEGKGGGEPILKPCVGCGFNMPVSVRICPRCFMEQPIKEKKLEQSEFVSYTYTELMNKLKSMEDNNEIFFTTLIEMQKAKEYRIGWLYTQIYAKLGILGLAEFSKYRNKDVYKFFSHIERASGMKKLWREYQLKKNEVKEKKELEIFN